MSPIIITLRKKKYSISIFQLPFGIKPPSPINWHFMDATIPGPPPIFGPVSKLVGTVFTKLIDHWYYCIKYYRRIELLLLLGLAHSLHLHSSLLLFDYNVPMNWDKCFSNLSERWYNEGTTIPEIRGSIWTENNTPLYSKQKLFCRFSEKKPLGEVYAENYTEFPILALSNSRRQIWMHIYLNTLMVYNKSMKARRSEDQIQYIKVNSRKTTI